jgi:hypothetical protein
MSNAVRTGQHTRLKANEIDKRELLELPATKYKKKANLICR